MPSVQDGKVDARELHEALNVGTAFTVWLTRRAEEFGFEIGVDYFPNLESKRIGSVSHNRTDYLLTLDTAKELAMVERTDKGREIRRYFIECEKQLREIHSDQTPELPASPLEKLQQINAGLISELSNQTGRIDHLETQLAPGADWIAISVYLDQLGVEYNNGWLTNLTRRCVARSAELRLPMGEDRSRANNRRRTFAPAVLDDVVPKCIDRWEANRRAKEQEVSA